MPKGWTARCYSSRRCNHPKPNTVADRYTSQLFVKKAHYDVADRVDAETVGGQSGTPVSAFDGTNLGLFFVGGSTTTNQDKQAVRTNYTRRGTVQSVDGSYGTLVTSITRRADGLVTNLVYGDSAATQTATTYDDRRRPTSIQTFRAGSPLWSAFGPGGSGTTGVTYSPAPSLAGTNTNFQMLLEDTDIAYDEVGNPIELRDWREPSEWPDSNKPVTKKIEYDDLYRVKRMDYLYATATGMDAIQSPFSKESSENWSPGDTRRAKPAPHLRFTNRPNWQKFDYDWLGNLSESDDNEHGFYDRSLGDSVAWQCQQALPAERREQLVAGIRQWLCRQRYDALRRDGQSDAPFGVASNQHDNLSIGRLWLQSVLCL